MSKSRLAGYLATTGLLFTKPLKEVEDNGRPAAMLGLVTAPCNHGHFRMRSKIKDGKSPRRRCKNRENNCVLLTLKNLQDCWAMVFISKVRVNGAGQWTTLCWAPLQEWGGTTEPWRQNIPGGPEILRGVLRVQGHRHNTNTLFAFCSLCLIKVYIESVFRSFHDFAVTTDYMQEQMWASGAFSSARHWKHFQECPRNVVFWVNFYRYILFMLSCNRFLINCK